MIDFKKQLEEMERVEKALSGVKNIIAVVSGKGGVGKTTISVAIARDLKKRGFKVGLLDTDLHGPNTAIELGVSEQLLTKDGTHVIPGLSKEGIHVVSMSLALTNADAPIIWRGPMKIAAIKQFITDTLWEDLDYLIIDTPPGSGDETLTLYQTLKRLNGSIIVGTSNNLAISDCRKSVNFIKTMKSPTLGLIDNMSYFICDNCKSKHYLFGKDKIKDLANEYNLPYLGSVPIKANIEKEIKEVVDNVLKEIKIES